MHGVKRIGKLFLNVLTYSFILLILQRLCLYPITPLSDLFRFLDVVKGTAKIKISSKREGEESETESYTSTPGQGEELGKDGDLHGVTSSNESMPQTPQQNIQSSSDIGSGQHQNPSQQLIPKPSPCETVGSQKGKPTVPTATSNPLSAPAHELTSSQPKSNSTCSPLSSQDNQSPQKTTVTPISKQTENSSISAEKSKPNLENDSSNGAASTPSMGTSNAAPVSSIASSTKTSSSNSSTQLQIEPNAVVK